MHMQAGGGRRAGGRNLRHVKSYLSSCLSAAEHTCMAKKAQMSMRKCCCPFEQVCLHAQRDRSPELASNTTPQSTVNRAQTRADRATA